MIIIDALIQIRILYYKIITSMELIHILILKPFY